MRCAAPNLLLSLTASRSIQRMSYGPRHGRAAPSDLTGDRDGQMNVIPGTTEAAKSLKRTALRGFGPPSGQSDYGDRSGYRLEFTRSDAPVPALMRFALELVGLRAFGPAEKVAWWVDFTYQGQLCQLAHQKFGLRLRLWTDLPRPEADRLLKKASKQLRSSTRIVEKLIVAAAPELLGGGDATVVNQHWRLWRAYVYFRERAEKPTFIVDRHEEHQGRFGKVSTFTDGQALMRLSAFHDLVAAITAYLSLLEHDLVLALAFSDFDPTHEQLTAFIGSRWAEKYRRILGTDKEATEHLARLTAVVERWRNPYSHGGFEKGHGATVYLHPPGVGVVPVGMTSVRESPLFSIFPADDTDITEVFKLFDELQQWVKSSKPQATRWIESSLDVRFDEDFRMEAAKARDSGRFDEFVGYAEDRQAVVDNMDY
jgi:hypothetical protein